MDDATKAKLDAATERANLIASARSIEDFDVPGDEPGRMEGVRDRELGAALEVLVNHSAEDEFAERWASGYTPYFRFGRWHFWRNINGHWSLAQFESVWDARVALDDYRLPDERELTDLFTIRFDRDDVLSIANELNVDPETAWERACAWRKSIEERAIERINESLFDAINTNEDA